MTNRTRSSLVLTVLAGAAVLCHSAAASQRIAFVTSVSGSGDLGSWEQADGATGIAAGDAVCQRRASSAALPNPMDFVAWLSDSSNDAYCRAHGLSGTMAGNCGQPSLPDFAGPWIHVDGTPFMPRLGLALGQNGVVYLPATLDESGDPLYAQVFTATSAGGEYLGSVSAACADWTSSGSDPVLVGDATAGTVAWTSGGQASCSSAAHLLCLQVGAGDPLPPLWTPGALMFVTSISGTADLGAWPAAGGATGLAAGNAICRNLAAEARLPAPSSFVAWLSDAATDASDQLSLDGPWTRIDGIPIAASLVDLVDGRLTSAPNVDEAGTYLGDEHAIWTGSASDGLGTGQHCDEWSIGDMGSTGTAGAPYRTNGWWSSYGPPNTCGGVFHLCCFSNTVAVVFADDFESGTTDAWSIAAP